jgi:NAD(P)-dependent dehydrogenase (short-subunit alcohol dehydrogenase family)
MAFLNSRAASYVTGQDLAVDAGLLGGVALGLIESTLVTTPAPG